MTRRCLLNTATDTTTANTEYPRCSPVAATVELLLLLWLVVKQLLLLLSNCLLHALLLELLRQQRQFVHRAVPCRDTLHLASTASCSEHLLLLLLAATWHLKVTRLKHFSALLFAVVVVHGSRVVVLHQLLLLLCLLLLLGRLLGQLDHL
jgi:hypothetical protein